MIAPRTLLSVLFALGASACAPAGEPFTEPLVLGGVEVDPATLQEGRDVYVRTCAACHGDDGDGRGPAAPSLGVAPRDFRNALFKYAGVPAGELPNDEDLVRTLRRGLPGTPMLAWDLTDRERRAVVHYLKTFSPKWRRRRPPPPVRPTPDPWQGRTREAADRGAALFHLQAQCAGCHGAYETRAALAEMSRAAGVELAPPEAFERRARDSEFFAGTEPIRIVPTDFLEDTLKNGTSPEELYRTIAAGVGGTSMPRWQGALPEEDLWAIVHYTRSLLDRRRSP